MERGGGEVKKIRSREKGEVVRGRRRKRGVRKVAGKQRKGAERHLDSDEWEQKGRVRRLDEPTEGGLERQRPFSRAREEGEKHPQEQGSAQGEPVNSH